MITQSELKRLFHYDPETGIFTRLVTRGNRALAGARAGTPRPDGYLKITIDKKHYLAHRLAWLYMRGVWPSEMLDHKNLDRSDTRFDNLREATRSENYTNTRCRSHSTIGVKGVTRNGDRWMARISVDSSAIYLGTYDTVEQAHSAYMIAANKIRGEFARAA